MRTTFIRLLDDDDKAQSLRSVVDGSDQRKYHLDINDLRAVPRSPFAYWLGADLRRLFGTARTFASTRGQAKQGLATGDNFRHIRAWWEVSPDDRKTWHNFANGGRLSPYYADLVQLLGYDDAHQEGIRATGRFGRGATFYGRPGLTWAVRSSRFAPSVLPSGCIFSHRGYTIFVDDPGPMAWMALLNSKPVDFLFKVHLGRFGFPEFLVGIVPLLPMPEIDESSAARLHSLGHAAWLNRQSLDTGTENSHAFVVPAGLQVNGRSLAERENSWSGRVTALDVEFDQLQSEIDDLGFALYGMSADDQRAITAGFGNSDDGAGDPDIDEVGISDDDGTPAVMDQSGMASGLLSWAVGVAIGRFDVRLATGDRPWPSEPDPFDQLPVCSPAMLIDGDGVPLRSAPVGYPLLVSPVLVDDPGHELDLGTRVRAVFDVLFGDDADRWWSEVGAVLDARTGDVEPWLRKSFFEYHLKTYSKSRRKAPVLWPLGTRSGSYRVWLYAHRVTADSVFRVLNDIVGPKLHVEERHLSDLRQEVGPSPSAPQRKAIDVQETFVAELREFRDELAAVAPLWAPDLNDGVVIVLAPLWRLFAYHRGWSSELKDRWKKLAAGDYDWAQLAMRLWPERVIPKCAEDRSLAMAHGLEDVFWVADKDNPDKWHPRTIPTTQVEELIAARTNPTITTARQHPTP